ncbi:MAG: hypothetical protein ACTSU5_21670, partial [Promethearchaeota archaeon]
VAAYCVVATSAVFLTLIGPPGVGSLLVTVALFVVVLDWYFHSVRIHRQAPRDYKKVTGTYSVGILLFGVIPLLLSRRVTGMSLVFPSIDRVTMTCGALIVAIASAAEPRLAFILPFRVKRLVLFDLSTGSTLYTRKWDIDPDRVDEELFPKLVEGLSRLVPNALSQGEVNSLEFRGGTLLVRRVGGTNLGVALVTTRPTRSLRYALEKLARLASEVIGDALPGGAGELEAVFAPIVEQCFPFVPEWKRDP